MAALRWLRQDTTENIQSEVGQIEEIIDKHKTETSRLQLRDLRKLWKPLSIYITLLAFEVFCGNIVVIKNTQEIFQKAGFTGPADTAGSAPAMIVAAGKVLATILVIPLLDKFGRRPICITSGSLMGVSVIVLGAYFYLQDSLDSSWTWVALVCLMIYTAAYSFGWGSVLFIVSNEILPIKYRGWVFGCGRISMGLFSFSFLAVYPAIVRAIEWSGLFWLCGSVCLLGVLFVIFILPETKCKSLEDIEQELSSSGSKVHK